MEDEIKKINLIDVSGFNYSGKSAVMDVLREFDKVTVHPKKFEFPFNQNDGWNFRLKKIIV